MDLITLQWVWITEILLKAIMTDACENINIVWHSQFLEHFIQIIFVMQQQPFNHMALCNLK